MTAQLQWVKEKSELFPLLTAELNRRPVLSLVCPVVQRQRLTEEFYVLTSSRLLQKKPDKGWRPFHWAQNFLSLIERSFSLTAWMGSNGKSGENEVWKEIQQWKKNKMKLWDSCTQIMMRRRRRRRKMMLIGSDGEGREGVDVSPYNSNNSQKFSLQQSFWREKEEEECHKRQQQQQLLINGQQEKARNWLWGRCEDKQQASQQTSR